MTTKLLAHCCYVVWLQAIVHVRCCNLSCIAMLSEVGEQRMHHAVVSGDSLEILCCA